MPVIKNNDPESQGINRFEVLSEAFHSATGLDEGNLMDLIRIAALFHDSARDGDITDLWDPDSARNCEKYLKEVVLPQMMGGMKRRKEQSWRVSLQRRWSLRMSLKNIKNS